MMTDAAPLGPATDNPIEKLAREKMTRILGSKRAELLLRKLFDEGHPLSTPDDLFVFATALSKLDGIESAVGALLCARAVIMGANPRIPE